jgi:hypothetical protein
MASAGAYQNAESIKCVTVTGPYRIDQNHTVQPLQGLIEMDPEQPIPTSVSVDLPVSQAPMMQFPEPPEVLQNDPTEDIAQQSQQKLFVFMFQILCII